MTGIAADLLNDERVKATQVPPRSPARSRDHGPCARGRHEICKRPTSVQEWDATMIVRDFRVSRRRPWPVAVFLALIALSLSLESSPTFHAHANKAGIYNGECPLVTLAAFHGAAPLPTAFTSAWLALPVGRAPLAAGARLAAAALRHTDPRAPPLV